MNKSCNSTCNFIEGLIANNKKIILYPKKQYGSKLLGTTTSITPASQGISVAINASGDTIAIGGTNDNALMGAVWIFSKINGIYTQVAKLVATGNIGASGQGSSVSLNAAGDVLAVGGWTDNTNVGAVWIWTRSSLGIWSQQTKLVAPDNIGPSRQGHSVSLNTFGNVLAVGGYSDNTNQGATWIWQYSNINGWQQEAKLVANNAIGASRQGWSVSLNGMGNLVAVGGYADNSNTGAVWLWANVCNSWIQIKKIVASNNIGIANQGISVSLNKDGNVLAFGGYTDNSNIGAVWIYNNCYGSWISKQKLTVTGTVGKAETGFSVSLNAKGNVLAVGGIGDNTLTGATWIFTNCSGIWCQKTKLIGDNNTNNLEQGYSSALNYTGNILVVGGPFHPGATGNGGTWVFTN